MSLEGRGALVTGATSGIGVAIATSLASKGANVVVTGRNKTRGNGLVRALADAGPGRFKFEPADLTTRDAPLLLAETAEGWLGGVDVLVNNAAIGSAGPSAEISIDDWDATFNLNVRGPYLLSSYILPRMAQRGRGTVVNITSAVAYRGWPGYAAYSASKAALDSMTRCWAANYGPSGVRVNAVSPGSILTPRALRDTTPEVLSEFCGGFGGGRYGTSEEVASAVAFLSSPDADYVHGATLYVDGGMVETYGFQPIAVTTSPLHPDPAPARTKKGRIFRRSS